MDLSQGQLTVRGGKGDKDCYVMLAHGVAEGLRQRQLWRRQVHEQDLSRGFDRVEMQTAQEGKFPNAYHELA